jgi:hypothetical protein
MPRYRDYVEWNTPQERFEDLLRRRVDNEPGRGDAIEQMFDAAIRHRFGLMISKAKLNLKKRRR